MNTSLKQKLVVSFLFSFFVGPIAFCFSQQSSNSILDNYVKNPSSLTGSALHEISKLVIENEEYAYYQEVLAKSLAVASTNQCCIVSLQMQVEFLALLPSSSTNMGEFFLPELNPKCDCIEEFYYRLGEGLEYSNRPIEGMSAFQKAHQLSLDNSDYEMQVLLDRKMANLHSINGRHNLSWEYRQRTLSLIEEHEFPSNFEESVLLGAYEQQVKQFSLLPIDPDGLQQQLLKSREIALNADRIHTANLLSEFLKELALKTDQQSVIDTIKSRSPERLKKISQNQFEYFDLLASEAKIAIKQNKITHARECWLEMEAQKNESHNIEQTIIALEVGQQIAQDQENWKQAYRLAEEYIATRKILMTNERINALNLLDDQLREQKNKQEIALVQKEKEVILARSNGYLIAILSLSSMALITAYFVFQIYRNRKSLRKKNKILRRQSGELKSAIATKDRLFSIIGHDLRRPALAFRGLGKKIAYLQENKNPEVLVQLGEELEKSALEQSKLLDNVLFWSMSERELFSIQKKHFSVNELFSETASQFKPFFDRKNLSVIIEIDPNIYIESDRRMLKLILDNLIDNALKFSLPGKQVTLSWQLGKEANNLIIRDEGIGMTKERLQAIREQNISQSQAGTNGERGTGLGLDLVAELSKTLGATFSIDSILKEGTTVQLSFS